MRGGDTVEEGGADAVADCCEGTSGVEEQCLDNGNHHGYDNENIDKFMLSIVTDAGDSVNHQEATFSPEHVLKSPTIGENACLETVKKPHLSRDSSSHEQCSYFEFLRTLKDKVDNNWPEISSSLEEIRRSLFSKDGCLVNLTADQKNLMDTENHVCSLLDSLPSNSLAELTTWDGQFSPGNEAIVVLTQAANLDREGYKVKGTAFVVSKYISNTWQWDHVRVSGGAYGGFCEFDTHYEHTIFSMNLKWMMTL